jgi:hypothetical protein
MHGVSVGAAMCAQLTWLTVRRVGLSDHECCDAPGQWEDGLFHVLDEDARP